MSSSKTYLVETWDTAGAKQNHYEVVLETPAGVTQLHKFLMSKFGHVVISPVKVTKPAAAAKRGRR